MSFLLGLLGSIFKGLGDALFGWIGRNQENAANVERGQDEQKVADLQAAKVLEDKATVATDSARRDVSSDDGLRRYEATDPNNRDNP